MPGALIHQELSEVLDGVGHDPSTLTLEQLREAMLAYLESFGPDLHSNLQSDLNHLVIPDI